jgi:hypothetical protein
MSLIEDQLEEKTYVVRFGQGVTNRMGGRDDRNQLAVLSYLQSLMNRTNIDLVDEFGRDVTVKVQPGLAYDEIEDDGGWTYEVRFRVKIQKRPFYWGMGATWGDSYVWS